MGNFFTSAPRTPSASKPASRDSYGEPIPMGNNRAWVENWEAQPANAALLAEGWAMVFWCYTTEAGGIEHRPLPRMVSTASRTRPGARYFVRVPSRRNWTYVQLDPVENTFDFERGLVRLPCTPAQLQLGAHPERTARRLGTTLEALVAPTIKPAPDAPPVPLVDNVQPEAPPAPPADKAPEAPPAPPADKARTGRKGKPS